MKITLDTIVFIGANKSGSSREAIKVAESLGYFTVLLTDREKFLKQRREFPDVHHMVLTNLNSKDTIRKEIDHLIEKGLNVKSIMSLVDPFVSVACQIADEFGVNRTSCQAIEIMENKHLTRETMKDSKYNSYYLLIDGDTIHTDTLAILERKLPLIIKSPKSTGSKDVVQVSTMKELISEFLQMREKTSAPILIEEYLDGPQFLVEAVVYKGNISIAGMVEQEITKDLRFIVTGYTIMKDEDSDLARSLKQAAEDIIRHMGLENGTCHLELRLVRGSWKLIEINPRISGGAMNTILKAAYGFNCVEETIKLYLGERPNLSRKTSNYVHAHYTILKKGGLLKRITGKSRAKQCPGVYTVYVKPKKGSMLVPASSMGHRYAYVIAIGHSKEEAIKNARIAAGQITFHLADENRVEKELPSEEHNENDQ